ncbi:MAG: peptidoglycan DD-metalloendopeptidase family protein [Bacteroides sp.]|nr:peptidoglycan DD-metalloendopeptidase family protein [Bacteroides sp.]MCM1414208.1 peptidoglycan DD-metalloendopeptidase family protein [Bacteroides sp.]MCM1472030.1 peptidoglycan DD-metalloendopeptidase family protein [Bacteroides sp.]
MRRLLILTMVIALLAVTTDSSAEKPRTIKKARTEQQATKKRINETTRKLSDNQKRTEKTMNELNLIRGEISQTQEQISKTRSQVDSINTSIRQVEDSLSLLDSRLQLMTDAYVKALRRLQTRRSFTDEISYIFSSSSFAEAYARMRYVREFAQWRKRKSAEIRRAKEEIGRQRTHLDELHSQRTSSLNLLSNDEARLKARQDETDKLVAQLQSDGKSLQKALEKERSRLKTIDNEISAMIEAERRERERQEQERKKREAREKGKAKKDKKGGKQDNSKGKSKSSTPSAPAAPTTPKAGTQTKPKSSIDNSDPDAAMTAKFEAAKGSMMFPVASPYRVVGKYGSTAGQPFNTGIEIVLDGSATARAVFEGTVSRIFQNHDGNYSVMVRHGAYITVFYNIRSLSVKAGSKLKAGQTIGQVGVDDRYGKPMLHFEIRKGSQTLNPLQWVK